MSPHNLGLKLKVSLCCIAECPCFICSSACGSILGITQEKHDSISQVCLWLVPVEQSVCICWGLDRAKKVQVGWYFFCLSQLSMVSRYYLK